MLKLLLINDSKKKITMGNNQSNESRESNKLKEDYFIKRNVYRIVAKNDIDEQL